MEAQRLSEGDRWFSHANVSGFLRGRGRAGGAAKPFLRQISCQPRLPALK